MEGHEEHGSIRADSLPSGENTRKVERRKSQVERRAASGFTLRRDRCDRWTVRQIPGATFLSRIDLKVES
jgi:hypothetical protein